MKKFSYKIDGKQYTAYPSPWSKSIYVNVYEVTRPEWKFFNERFLGKYTFYMDDFETIEDGLILSIRKVVKRQKDREAIRRKIRDYNERVK